MHGDGNVAIIAPTRGPARSVAHFDGGAGGQRAAEVFVAHIDVADEFVDARDVSAGAHEIAQRRAGADPVKAHEKVRYNMVAARR